MITNSTAFRETNQPGCNDRRVQTEPAASHQRFIIGVAGGTGSGKTTVADQLVNCLPAGEISLIRLDSYYRDRSDLTFEERCQINQDHPDALDWPLLLDHLKRLVEGEVANVPTYDFTTHLRTSDRSTVPPSKIILVEGILIFADAALREMFDLKIYVDTDADVRFIRRLKRDIAERGRTAHSVIDQYLTTVRPMHMQFVEPSKRYADVIVPEGGMNQAALNMIIAQIRAMA